MLTLLKNSFKKVRLNVVQEIKIGGIVE